MRALGAGLDQSGDKSPHSQARAPRFGVRRFIAASGLVIAAIGFTPASAQIGDRQDKAGEVQRSLVPPDLIPPAPGLSPEEAMKTFKLAPGYKLELVASEPLVQEPVVIQFGTDGRMWVVEMRGYMPDLDGNGEDQPVGRIVVLRDRDGDGRYDESKVFLDELVLPRALLLVGDGALVGAPPELAYWRDTDGDGKADQKTLVAADYGVRTDPKRPMMANPERAPNSLLWAHDNWIYSTAYTKRFRFVNGAFETAPQVFRGQWGLGQDDFGRLYHGSNSDHLRVDIANAEDLQRNPHYPRLAGANVDAATDQLVWPARVTPGINRGYRPEMLRDGRLKEFTAACGWWVYRGDLMPELQGNVFVAEPAAHFVRRSIVTAGNGTLRGRNPYERDEFLTSTDERFRPVNFATGPDGALYIVDLYRGVLQHRISLTSYLRKQSEERGLVHPQHLGRIYRVMPADRAAPRATPLGPLTTAQWVERLSHPNAWWRETAQRLLVERRDPSVTDALRRTATKGTTPHSRLHALWTLEGSGALDRATLVAACDDADAIVRAAAARISRTFLPTNERPEIVNHLLALAKDASTDVQLQAICALGEARDAAVDAAAAEIVRTRPSNPFLRDAFLSGLKDRELPLLERLLADAEWPAGDAEGNKLLTGLVRGVFGSRNPAHVERVIALAAGQPANASARAVALLDGLTPATGGSRRPLTLAKPPAGWTQLENTPVAKTRLTRVASALHWPGKPGGAVADAAPLTAAQQQRFETGKTVFSAICAACHQANGRGLDGLAPPLVDSEWVLGSPERLIRVVLHGLRGQISVLGRVHMGDMPAFGALDDTQISSVLTYVRREWGHNAAAVEPEHVKAIRAATAGRTDAWTEGEFRRGDP